MLSPHMKDLSLEFLAAKSVKNGSNQRLAIAFIPTRNFTCYRGLLEPLLSFKHARKKRKLNEK